MHFMSPITQQLREKLQNPTTTIEEVLNDESCMRAYSQTVECIVDFFWHRADQLLDLALSPEKNEISTKAFMIATIPCDEIWQALVNNDILSKKSESVLVPGVNVVTISRFAAVAQHCCMCTPKAVPEKCGFLKKMIRFVHVRSVFDMFLEFFNSELRTTLVREVLRDWKFVDEIFVAIKEAKDAPAEVRDEYTTALLRLLSKVKSAELFDSCFASADAMGVLLGEFQEPSVSLLDAKWQVVDDVLCDANVEFVRPKVPAMVALLKIENGRFSAYQISVIEIIAKMLGLKGGESLCSVLMEVKLPGAIVEIATVLKRHTLVTLQVTNLVMQILRVGNRDLVMAVVPRIAELASQYVVSPESGIEERAFGWNFFVELRKSSETLTEALATELKERNASIYTDDVKDRVEQMDTIVSNPFGGELPATPDPDEIMMSQEQLLALLRFLTLPRG